MKSLKHKEKGFTLVEISIVTAIIGILMAIAIPAYKRHMLKSKEAVLKENLFVIRDCIQKFYQDKGTYPQELGELVTFRYLSAIPIDPITGKREWEVVFPEQSEDDYGDEDYSTIEDVKSKSDKISTLGTAYNEW